jgi:glycosyltransferase involved in cell wall biosynthesis
VKENQPPGSDPISVDAVTPSEVARRPFWSVMIPTYNRATYLERTLMSVLSQDPGPEEMQIEVVDDASTEGDPEAVVWRVGGGRVSFVRQPHNLGLVANWNSCIERSVGEWVHVLHSDDVVFPGFYATLRLALEGRDDVGAAFCRWALIDENDRWLETSERERATPGILTDFVERIRFSKGSQCPATVVRRSVYGRLGGFQLKVGSAADLEMWIRIAVHFPIWYEPEVLAAWRIHSDAATRALMRSGENIAEIRHCIAISRHLFSPGHAHVISRRLKEGLAVAALQTAQEAASGRDFKMACNQIREGLRCSVSPRIIKALLVLLFQILGEETRRAYAASQKHFSRTRS